MTYEQRKEREAKADTRRANRDPAFAAQQQRMAAQRAEATESLKSGCPRCGRPVRRNLALTGWVQCTQFGVPQYRRDPRAAACEWQGFTS